MNNSKLRPINEKLVPPLMSAGEGHFGYMGTLLCDEKGEKIECHICGKMLSTLVSHITLHKLTAREYKDKFELNYNTALVSPKTLERMIRASEKKVPFYWDKTPEEIHRLAVERGRKGQLALQKRTRKNGRRRYTVETMNRFGTCPAQLEERVIRIIDKLGHTPSWDELMSIEPTLLWSLVKRFKSYSNALHYFGLNTKRRTDYAEYGMNNIKKILRKFIDDTKRLPSNKDTKINGLPDYMTITKYFGSWMNAKQFCFEYLVEKYPERALDYDMRFRRIQ